MTHPVKITKKPAPSEKLIDQYRDLGPACLRAAVMSANSNSAKKPVIASLFSGSKEAN